MTSVTVHLHNDPTTADTYTHTARVLAARVVSFIYVGGRDCCICVESQAQFDEIIATLVRARKEWEEITHGR